MNVLRSRDNEAEDMDGDHQQGKQADLESGLDKKEVPRPTHISASEFVHCWRLRAALMTII